jgi:hypothetical protein
MRPSSRHQPIRSNDPAGLSKTLSICEGVRGDGAVVFPPSPVRENPLEVPDLEFDLVQG